VNTGLFIAVNFVEADVVLLVAVSFLERVRDDVDDDDAMALRTFP
jgi:hypothetical protein